MKTALSVRSWIMAGLGLLILGGAMWGLTSTSSAGNLTQATDFSSIPAKVQFVAPALQLKDMNGVERALSDYRGRVVLVNLWATWCPPCAAEMPILQRFYEGHSQQGLVVVAIEDGDPIKEVAAFVARYGLTFPIWLDPTYQATSRVFKTTSLPSSYVIDRLGNVRLMWLGAINEVNLVRYVTPLIQE